MKLIIAGPETIKDTNAVFYLIDGVLLDNGISSWTIDEVVSGCVRGVDRIGRQWANKQAIPLKTFVAEWSKYGKAAEAIRNEEMAKYADALLLIWDGESGGFAANMKKQAEKRKMPIFEVVV